MVPSTYRPLLPFKVSTCSLKSFVVTVVSLYFAAHFLAYLYSIFAVLDEKRTLEKKELYDGPLVLNDKYKNVLYGKKVNGVYTNVGVMNTALLYDQSKKSRRDSNAVPTIPEKFYETLSSSARSILSRQSHKSKEDRFVFFTFVNDAYSLMTMNWLCNADTFEGVLNRTIIATSSSTLCAAIKKEYSKVDCIKLALPSSFSSSLDWGKREYIQWLIMRVAILRRMVQSSIPFVLFETDAVWFRDPTSLFEQANKVDDVDIKVPVKGYTGRASIFHCQTEGQSLSFDPMFVYPTNGSKILFEEMNKRLTMNSSLYDQDLLDELCRAQFNGIICRTFEWKDIADGKWFKLSETERARYNPYIVNNNYYVGVKNKMTRQAMNHMWLLNPKSNSCSAVRRRKMFEENEALAALRPKEEETGKSLVDSVAVL